MYNYMKQEPEIYYELVPEIKNFEKNRGCVFVGVITDLQPYAISVENYHSNNPIVQTSKDAKQLPNGNYYCFVRHHKKRKKPYLELGNVNKIYCIDEWAIKNFGKTDGDYCRREHEIIKANNGFSRKDDKDFIVCLGNSDGLNDCHDFLNLGKITQFQTYCQNLQKISTVDILYQNYSVFDEDLLSLDELTICKHKYQVAEKNATKKVSCLSKDDAEILFFSATDEHAKRWGIIKECKNQNIVHGIIIDSNRYL